MLLVITGTIAPASQEFLKVSDTKERLAQYIDSIRFFVDSAAFEKIIFCDNSAYESDELMELIGYAADKKVSLELLAFSGNSDMVRLYGKGYGEGEIMKYIFENSDILKKEDEADLFVKVTGRLKVDNILKISKSLKKKICYINVPNKTRRDIFDTRVYAMPISLYRQYFMEAYKEVRDGDGIFYENVFKKIISENNLSHRNFSSYPRIVGISGTKGIKYSYSQWKCIFKDFMSIFNYYGVSKP